MNETKITPKQELHGIPMFRIFHAIRQMGIPNENGKKRYATSVRISELINKPTSYVIPMLDIYWGWSYVQRRPIKSAQRQDIEADGCTWHWTLTKRGVKKYQKLQARFGSVPPERTTGFCSSGRSGQAGPGGQNV